MNHSEVIHQVREIASSVAWGESAAEAALRAQPDDPHIVEGLNETLRELRSARRRIQNVTKWLTTGAAR